MRRYQVAAAEYIRMSTEHQRYSPENQREAIAAYALIKGYQIVQSFVDVSRSGLTAKGRGGLQELLREALSPTRRFEAVLVLDVSRWGRFQDPDEATHYEYLCREAGVEVQYCAEPFDEDPTSTGKLVKAIKRVMAAEYSRELSTKVLAAQRRLAAKGYAQGGASPFGVRRAIMADRTERLTLAPGEHKALTTDRIIYTPGPSEETRAIRLIFEWYVKERLFIREIEDRLKKSGIVDTQGVYLSQYRVRRVLSNQIYVGIYTYGKNDGILAKKRVQRPVGEWISVKMFDPIVPPATFEAAQARLDRRRRRAYSDDELLEHLRGLLARDGRLSSWTLKRAQPSASIYVKRFGSVREACDRIGHNLRQQRRLPGPLHDDDIIAGLREVLSTYGYLTQELARTHPKVPSSATMIKRFGGWIAAYRLAGWQVERSDIQKACRARRKRRNQLLDELSSAEVPTR